MLTNIELGEYLKNIRENKGISLREVEKLTGIGYSHLSMIENGKRNVTPALLKNLSQIYGADYIDLYEKAGYIDLAESEKLKNTVSTNINIPILGTVKAGYNWLAEENITEYLTLKEDIPNKEEYFALRITGDSMLPLLSEGDLVIVHSQDDVESGQTAVILINGEEATVKKIIKTNEGIELHAMNPYYPVKKFTFEDMKNIPVKIIGRVRQAKIKGFFE
jgi:repressor LexA